MIGLGVCDVHSHGLDHMVHYTSDRLTGFLHPRSHWMALAAAGGDTRLGTPLYETSSVLVRPRYGDPLPIRDRLAGIVADSSGASFFGRPDWAAILQEEFDAVSASVGVGTFGSEEAWEATVLDGFHRCIHELPAQTGSAVQPWRGPSGRAGRRPRRSPFRPASTLP